MRLASRCNERLPELAWCLSLQQGGRAELLHGRGVELDGTRFFEGAWDGDFAIGHPDEAVSCMGSGGRLDAGEWVIATPSHTLESVYSVRAGAGLHLSNSFVFLLTRTRLTLDPDYRRYLLDLRSGAFGLSRYVDRLSTAEGVPLIRHLACNLRIGEDLGARRHPKPLPPRFGDFAGYRSFLAESVERLAGNAAHPARRQVYRMPTIGARRHPDIHRITLSHEMDPWRVHCEYDRPIPRRIAETRGVPRDWFGQGKSATAVWWTLRAPKAESALAYARYRASRRRSPARLAEETLHRLGYGASRAWFRGTRLLVRVLRKAGIELDLPQIVPRRFTEPADQDMLVQWGASVVAARYCLRPPVAEATSPADAPCARP